MTPDSVLTEAVIRVFLAVVLGSVVGLERELTLKSAGLRTHILVCLGATVYMIISTTDLLPGSGLKQDPGRIAAQIVTGIGFIGGGAVLRHGTNVRGLTTAASLWIMAAIGMLVGIGHYRLSCIVTLVTFLVLFTIGNMERYVFGKHLRALNRLQIRIQVDMKASSTHASTVQAWLEQQFGKDILALSSHDETSVPDGGGKTNASHTSVVPGEGPANTVSLLWLNAVVGIYRSRMDLTALSQRINALGGVISSELRMYHADEE